MSAPYERYQEQQRAKARRLEEEKQAKRLIFRQEAQKALTKEEQETLDAKANDTLEADRLGFSVSELKGLRFQQRDHANRTEGAARRQIGRILKDPLIDQLFEKE